MAIMSDGLAQDDVIQPSAIARSKRIEFVAVAIGKFYGKEQLMDITGGRRDRILRFQHVNKTVDISQQLHDAIMKSVQEQCSQNITSWEMFTTATEKTTTSSTWSPHFPSPQNGDIKTNCKDGSMEVTISKTPPYRGWLLVKGHQKKKGCFWDYTNNKEDNIRTTIDYNTCQAETRRSVSESYSYNAVQEEIYTDKTISFYNKVFEIKLHALRANVRVRAKGILAQSFIKRKQHYTRF
ncbi:hypothetical protein D918_00704 [Trichuris suis]|nr:hypothetical protein D918_00704 [Trichuris suis]